MKEKVTIEELIIDITKTRDKLNYFPEYAKLKTNKQTLIVNCINIMNKLLESLETSKNK